jgi:TolB-like protein/tetratricopeptide (TPR) repeat protein
VPVKSPTPNQQSKRDAAVRRVLSSIVQSKAFRQVDRLQRFLTYIVEETLAGRGDSLKEYPVGVDVFGKDSSFDPRMDPIVRVQARRLRMRLVTYYAEEGMADPVVIELPKGGYAPTFRAIEPTVSPKKVISNVLVSRNSVAVMPFEDDSATRDQKHFGRGIAEEIIQALGALPSLVVKSANSPDARQSVAIVIEGSVRKNRDVLRITTHITDTLRGSYVWSESVDRKVGDDFAVQEEIARRVVEVLGSQLLDRTSGVLGKGVGTNNVAAHNLYLQGRYHLEQRTEPGLHKALEFFNRAIEEDPRMAGAYAGLADAYNLMAHYGVLAPSEVWLKAAANATQAVLIDDESSEAHTSLAHLKATQDWDWAEAEREFLRAISLNPQNATAHLWYGVSCLASLGRLEEALTEVKLAQALDPVSSIVSRNIALIYYYQRNLDLALEQIDQTIEQNPHYSAAYWTLGLIQEQRGELDEAIAAFERAIELSPPSPRIMGALGGVLAKDGRKQEAANILLKLKEISAERYISPFEPALINFNSGKREEGFELLTKAFEDRAFEIITIHIDPRFDGIRNDPRYKTLFKKLNLS